MLGRGRILSGFYTITDGYGRLNSKWDEIMIQDFIDKNFFRLLLFTLVFGVVFYDTIGFDYTDELCALFLFVLFFKYVFSTSKWGINKMFLGTTVVFLFYLFYSFYIGSNSKAGIVTDFICQYKPYLGFFCVYAMKPDIPKKYRKVICEICLVLGAYLFLIGIAYLFSPSILRFLKMHPSRLATAATVVALTYLYCSEFAWTDKVVFVLIMAIGCFSGRSKAYGFFIICAAMIGMLKPSFKWKLNLKSVLLFSILAMLVFMVTYHKIDMYFISGGDFANDNEEIQNSIARAALYFNSVEILTDYFPFGSGFATYGTYASGVYYSDIYVQYGMDGIFGLTKNNATFVADTYYPSLAQFGVVGTFLFFAFWIYLGLKGLKYYQMAYKETLMVLMIVGFFLIECVADTTITHNRGFYMMMLLGLLFSDLKKARLKQLN